MHAERDAERAGVGTDAETAPEMATDDRPKHGGRRPGAGRKTSHGLARLRRSVAALTTRGLDGRTVMAREVRRWKDEVRRDLGVTRKRRVLDVVMQRMQIADSLARNLERFGLGRRA